MKRRLIRLITETSKYNIDRIRYNVIILVLTNIIETTHTHTHTHTDIHTNDNNKSEDK